MAKQTGIIKLKGTIGGMTFYKTSADGHFDPCEPLKFITQIVTESVDVSALYCIGQRNVSRSAANLLLENNAVDFHNTHYYLFLIVKDFQSEVPGNIAFKIQSQTEGRCKATVIMHSKKSLYQK